MEMHEITKHIMDIKVAVGQIESHLKDMNGKLLKADHHISVSCSENRSKLHEKINEIKMQQTRNTIYIGIGMGLIVAGVQYILKVFLN